MKVRYINLSFIAVSRIPRTLIRGGIEPDISSSLKRNRKLKFAEDVITVNNLTHFEIPADNPKRAAKFYETIFGWEIKKWGEIEYWLINTKHGKKPGIDGGLMKRDGLFKKKGGVSTFICTIEVKDLEEIAKKVKKAGGKWANEGGLIHGVGFHQYFKDTEGNIFGCLQPDTKAKNVP